MATSSTEIVDYLIRYASILVTDNEIHYPLNAIRESTRSRP